MPIHPDDWHLLGCQLERGGEAFEKQCLSRSGKTHTVPHLPLCHHVGHVEVGGAHFRPAFLVFFLLCEVLGCLLCWNKTNGGSVTNWVGFEQPLK